MELTKEQIQRQDVVDNACYGQVCELAKGSDVTWDIEDISAVREVVQGVLVEKRHIMSKMEFYPYLGQKEIHQERRIHENILI